MAYLIIIAVSIILIYIPNAIFNPAGAELPWVYYLIAIAIFVVGEFLIDALVAIVGRKLPESWINPKKGMILTRDWEMKFYLAIKVNKWKDYIPDLGRFTNFPKGNLMDPFNNEYIKKYILEAGYGVVIHYMSVPFSLLMMLIMLVEPTNPTIWTVGVPVIIINMILIVLPAFSLKFNLPRLVRICDMNERFLAKHAKESTNEDIEEN